MVELFLKLLILANAAFLSFTFISAWFGHKIASVLSFDSSFSFHVSFGIFAVLLSLFIELCIIFYFVGSGIWMRDKARELHHFNKALGLKSWESYQAAGKLKGKTFPWASVALVFLVFTFILGGARQVGSVPLWIHPTLAGLLTLVSFIQIKPTFAAINKNIEYLDSVSSELEESPIKT